MVVSGIWQAPIRVVYACTREWPEFPNRYATLSESWPESIVVRALNMKVEYTPLSTFGSWPANNVCSNSFNGQYTVRQSVTLGENMSFQQSASADYTAGYSVADGTTFLLDTEAEFAFWADVEEFFEVTVPMAERDSQGFPNYAGTAVADGLRARSVRFFERLRQGGEMGVSVGGLAPKSLTRTISSADVVEVGEVDYALDRRGSVYVNNDLAALAITGDVDNQTVTANYVRESSDASFDARPGFVLQIERPIDTSGTAYGYSRALPDTRVRWSCGIACGSDWLEEPVTVALQRRSGAVDTEVVEGRAVRDFDQTAWEAFCVLDGVAQDSIGFDDRTPFRTWLPPATITAVEGDPLDWRMMFRGRRWLAFELAHPEEQVIDDGETLAGWSAMSGSVSLEGGVRWDVGSEDSLMRGFSPAVAAESYRYLRIRGSLDAPANRTLELAIEDKKWEVRIAPGSINAEFDLCLPLVPSDESDDQESRHPLDSTGKVVDGPMWGISAVESLTISGLAEGDEFLIDSVELFRKGPARFSSLPSFNRFARIQTGQPESGRIGAWSAVDGRVTDLLDMGKSSGVPFWRTIADLAADLTARGGWQIIGGFDPADGYHGPSREAEHLLGGGILADDEVLTLGIDLEFGGEPSPVMAQALWDEVAIYPGAGNVWTPGGTFGTRTVLPTGKILRAQGWGLLGQRDSARSGRLVQFMRDGIDLRGEDTSNSRGEFLTHLPGGLSDLPHQIVTGSITCDPFIPVVRFRHRRVLRWIESAGGVAFDWHPSGLSVRASAEGEGIRLRFLSNSRLAAPREVLTSIVAQSCAIRFMLGHKLGLTLVTAEDGQILERESHDLGETWSMPVLLAESGASYPALALHPDGRRFVYWIKAGSVEGVIRDQSGAVLSTVASARTGVDDSGLAVGTLDRPGGKVDIEILTVESGALVSSVSSDGATFS